MKTILIILISVFLFTSCNKNKKNNDKNESNSKTKVSIKTYKLDNSSPLLLLPEKTEAILNFKSIKSAFSNLEINDNSVFGINIDKEVVTFFKKLISINPLNLKELESIGIDINKEVGVSFSDILFGKHELSSINIISYIPLKDTKKFSSHLESKFVNGTHINFNELSLIKENGYIKISGKRADERLYLLIKNNYLFIIINPFDPQLALNAVKSLKTGKSLIKDNKVFNQTIKLAKINSGMYFYADIENIINSNQVRIEKEFRNKAKLGQTVVNTLKSYKSFAISIDFDTNDFIMNVLALLNKDSKVFSILKDIKYDNSIILGVDKPALMLMSFGINIKEYINFLKTFMEARDNEEMNKQIKIANKEFGINLQKDLIDNFDGNFGYATYDGMSISTTNYNSIMTVGFKNVKLIENLIDKLLSNKKLEKFKKYVNKTSLNGKTIYVINAVFIQIYAGFYKNKLIIASNKNIYEAAMASSKEKGFYKYAKNDKILNELSNGKIIFYVSFLEVIKALNNFKALLPPKAITIATDTLELLNYFSTNVNMNDDTMFVNYVLKTNSKKMFFPSVADLVKKYIK